MGSKVIPQPCALYKYPRPDIFSHEIFSRLPEAYKNFYKEWKMTTPSPVHYIPKEGKWERDPKTGEVRKVQNVPIPLKYPNEIHQGIWGGETVVLGYQKRHPMKRRVPHFWIPRLRKSVVYSEILDKTMSTTVTNRTINLVLQNHGFDHYILKTPACDLYSLLALKLKRKMLFALMDRTLYPDDPVKQEQVYNKYKHYLDSYTREDLEWYGLSITEAQKKLEKLEEVEPVPLKQKYRLELVAKLREEGLLKVTSPQEPEEKSWIAKINPFSKN